ncbi:MAG: alpha/beta hydrolase [Weeksellaceae bacterium]
MAKLSLQHFHSIDNLKLPGLLYEPEKPTDAVALFLHGNGSSSVFYSSMTNALGKSMTDQNISFFAFNNRGALYTKSLKRINSETNTGERVTYGSYIELIKECELDIEGAINFLETKGYKHFYLIGHSTGANKIAIYNYYKQDNKVEKYILLAGGDDTGLNCDAMGEDNFWKAIKRSKTEIEKGNGMKTVPKSLYPQPYTYQALYDTLNPDGDYNIFPYYEVIQDQRLGTKKLFREVESIVKPTLVIYGEHDEYCYGNVDGCVKILQTYIGKKPNFEYQIIPEANHGFDGFQEDLGDIMASWLSK